MDDDSDLRDYLKQRLNTQFVVEEAENGLEALKQINEKQPDIIICDVIMPVMDGLSLLKKLKSNTSTSHIPVVVLSSRNEISDRKQGWEKGADAYMSKPFNFEELSALIDNVLYNRWRLKGKYSGLHDVGEDIEMPKVKSSDQNLVERILKVTRKEIDNSEFNVEHLSSEVGISRAHLHRRMKELMGITPLDFIRNVRMHRACELLKNSEVEITQVAYTLGFASQSHFSTTFKKFTGYTPSEYREKSMAGEKLPDYGTNIFENTEKKS